jgi:hypothetical protein
MMLRLTCSTGEPIDTYDRPFRSLAVLNVASFPGDDAAPEKWLKTATVNMFAAKYDVRRAGPCDKEDEGSGPEG